MARLMRTFEIAQNTPGLLIIQEEGADVITKNHQATKTLRYTDENVLVDPVKIANFGNAAYEKNSMAQRLAQDGYIVFSDVVNQASKYMFAVRYADIKVS